MIHRGIDVAFFKDEYEKHGMNKFSSALKIRRCGLVKINEFCLAMLQTPMKRQRIATSTRDGGFTNLLSNGCTKVSTLCFVILLQKIMHNYFRCRF